MPASLMANVPGFLSGREDGFLSLQGGEDDARSESGLDARIFSAFKEGKTQTAYGKELQATAVLHISGHNKLPGRPSHEGRMLRHWYAALAFPQLVHFHRMQRVARDALRYNDAIFCKASEIVAALGGARAYASIHVRRGDFQ